MITADETVFERAIRKDKERKKFKYKNAHSIVACALKKGTLKKQSCKLWLRSTNGKKRMKKPFNINQLWKSSTGVTLIFYVDGVGLTWVLFRTKDIKGTCIWHMGPSALSGFVGLWENCLI